MVNSVGTINNEQDKHYNKYMNDVPVNCLPENEPLVCTGNFCRLISHRSAKTNIMNLLKYSYIIIILILNPAKFGNGYNHFPITRLQKRRLMVAA